MVLATLVDQDQQTLAPVSYQAQASHDLSILCEDPGHFFYLNQDRQVFFHCGDTSSRTS